MNDKLNPGNRPTHDQIANALVRSGRADTADGRETWPSAETVAAYLLDSASDSQVEEVQAALASSSDFRCELKQIAADLDGFLAKASGGGGIDPAGIEPPSRQDFIASCEKTRSSITRAEPGAWIRKLVTFWRPVPVFATVATILFLIGIIGLWPRIASPPESSGELVLVESSLEPSLLIGNRTRNGADRRNTVFSTPREAALDAYRGIFHFVGGELALRAPEREEPNREPGQTVIVKLTDIGGNTLAMESFSVPNEISSEDSGLEFWAVTGSGRDLYRASLEGPVVNLLVPDQLAGTVCLTITYRSGDGYRAGPVVLTSINSD
ncbi:MAG: hypothetical protein ABIF77_20960 [bacterium]